LNIGSFVNRLSIHLNPRVGLEWKLLCSEDEVGLNTLVAQQTHAYARTLQTESLFRIQHAGYIYSFYDPLDCAIRDVLMCDTPPPNNPVHRSELAEHKNKIEDCQSNERLQERQASSY